MTKIADVPWTPFERAYYPEEELARMVAKVGPDVVPHELWSNSRYQVSVWFFQHPIFGDVAHLSFKTHDREPRHDWREMQRIKNELAGPECDAIEIYPAESKLVDSANQYHLFVFRTYKIDVGFQTRLVSEEATFGKGRQRPFEEKPPDLLSNEQIDELAKDPTRESAHVQKLVEFGRLTGELTRVGRELGMSTRITTRSLAGVADVMKKGRSDEVGTEVGAE